MLHEGRRFFRDSAKFIVPNPSPAMVHRIQAQDGISQQPTVEPGPSFLFVGALERSKGVSVLLNAIAAVKSSKVRFHVVGRGRLDRLVRESANRDSRIAFHGYVTREELTKLYESCDVLLFTSQWPEVF